jgi:hypothetical protein
LEGQDPAVITPWTGWRSYNPRDWVGSVSTIRYVIKRARTQKRTSTITFPVLLQV